MRVLFVLAMIVAVLVLGAASLYLYAAVIAAWQAGAYLSIRALVLPTVLLLGAGACAAGIFMKPREFRAAMQPPSEEVKPAAWIEQMRNEKQGDG